ncbi:MAG: hypothetical protein WBN40_00565 [Pseudomonadales bacterium]
MLLSSKKSANFLLHLGFAEVKLVSPKPGASASTVKTGACLKLTEPPPCCNWARKVLVLNVQKAIASNVRYAKRSAITLTSFYSRTIFRAAGVAGYKIGSTAL